MPKCVELEPNQNPVVGVLSSSANKPQICRLASIYIQVSDHPFTSTLSTEECRPTPNAFYLHV